MTSKSKKPKTSTKASFSEFEWTYNIIFLVECDEISNNFVSALNETEISDKRIRVIKKQEILNNLKQTFKPTTPSTQSSRGKSPKKLAKNDVKDEKLENDEQTIFNLLKGNKDHYLNLPPDSLANIVKQFINRLKVSYLEKTLSSKKGSKVTADKKSRKNVDSGRSKEPTSSQKSGKGKEKQEMVQDQNIVEGLQLPKCLIFTGFYEPLLPVEMNKLGLPVRAVVAMKKRTVFNSENVLPQENESENFKRQLSSKKFNFDFFKFWSYACAIDDVTIVTKSEDIADVDIELPEQIASVFETPKKGKNLSANTKKDLKLNINKFLTNLTTHLLYSVDIYNQYINSIETFDLDAEYRPLSEAKQYLYLSSLLPFECSDISFVLYNMVDQVSVWHDDKTEDSSIKIRRQKMYIPKIINHNNKIELKTFHLCTNLMRYDIHSVLQNYLSSNPAFNSWRGNKITKKQKELNRFHLKRLFKLADNIDPYLFDLYLHWYILRRIKLEMSSKMKSLKKVETTKDTYLNRKRLFRDSFAIKKGTKPQVKVEKWRRFSSMSVKHVNALRKANLGKLKKFIEISDIVELVHNDEIVEKLILDKDDSLFKFAEDLSPICLLQTIQDLTLGFLMCDKLHFKPSNKIVLWFHNDIGLTKTKDSFKVDTFLGFRGFYNNNMKEESILVSNLNEYLCEFPSSANLKSDRNGDLSLEIKNGADFNIKNDDSKNRESSKIKVCNLGGSEMELETSKKTFVSADSSSVVLEIDNWLNMTKTMKITIKKLNTELIYHKNMLQTPNEEKENSIYSNAILNLPDETRICVDIEEKCLPERFLKLFYNFSIVLPSGLSIEIVKTNDDYYVKQKYVFHSSLTESIKKEKYRCYLKAGHVIIFFKNGRIRILYCNGTIVDCDEIVDETQKTNEDGISSSLTRKSEENNKNVIKKDEKMKKKDKVRNEEPGKEDVVDQPEQKYKDNKKIPKKSSNSSDKTENKQKPKTDSKNDQSTQESDSLKSEKINSFSVLKQSITTAYGERITFDNGIERKKKSYSLRTIFQPYETLYIDRSDGYKALYTEDGSLFSTFADETKISIIPPHSVHSFSDPSKDLDFTSSIVGVYCRESSEYNSKNFMDEDSPDEDQSFTALNMMTSAEHPLYARVEYNVEQCAIRITLPGGMIIYVLENLNDFIIDVDSITTVIFSKENILFSCGLLETSGKENITVINSISKTIGLSKQALKPPIFCKTIDSFGKEFLIHNDGEVELFLSPTSNDSLELISNNSQPLARDYHFYDKIPSSQFERFFVVNQDFSGHEFVHKDDVSLFISNTKNRLKDKYVKITKNPSCGKLESKTLQYPLFENYFQRYSISYTNLESSYFPKNFLRSALSMSWNLNDSPWLFKGDVPIEKYVQSKVFQFQTKRENKPMAIVYRTLNEICRNNDSKVKNIATVVLSYEARNNELFCRYSRKRIKRRQLLDKFLGEVIEKPE